MARALNQAGYVVSESSNELQLEAGLKIQPFLSARNALLVLSAQLASRCARSISTASKERTRAGLPHARLIVTCEMGTLSTLHQPELALCSQAGVLEKPFDLHELRSIAMECRHRAQASKPSGA